MGRSMLRPAVRLTDARQDDNGRSNAPPEAAERLGIFLLFSKRESGMLLWETKNGERLDSGRYRDGSAEVGDEGDWRFLSRVGKLVGRRGQERLKEEIADILRCRLRTMCARMRPVEARRQAMLKLWRRRSDEGGLSRGGGLMVTRFVQDLRYAMRGLGGLGADGVCGFTLALGIGMASGTFSMVDALIFRPYPVPRPNEMVTVVGTTHDSNFEDFSYREYLDIRDKTQSYEGVVANAGLEDGGIQRECDGDAAGERRNEGVGKLFSRAGSGAVDGAGISRR